MLVLQKLRELTLIISKWYIMLHIIILNIIWLHLIFLESQQITELVRKYNKPDEVYKST